MSLSTHIYYKSNRAVVLLVLHSLLSVRLLDLFSKIF
nr:MAG TPA: hypothetical protein [Caudoviricetes sp.]